MSEQQHRVSLAARLLLLLVRGYQIVLSPFMGGNCRFYPSCSNYGLEAIQVHGAIKGSWLAIRRIGRCHPFHDGGIDPVPPRVERRAGSVSP
jgi:uncharacterized protein